MNPELQNYIAQSRQQGMTDDQIKQNLAVGGWKEKDLNQLIESGQSKDNGFSVKRVIRILLAIINTIVLIFASYVALVITKYSGGGLFIVLPLIFGIILSWVAIFRKSAKILLILISTELLFALIAFTLFWSRI